jgi:hypothetical protein
MRPSPPWGAMICLTEGRRSNHYVRRTKLSCDRPDTCDFVITKAACSTCECSESLTTKVVLHVVVELLDFVVDVQRVDLYQL